MNIKQLEYLISKPEGEKLDFKEKLTLNFDSDKKEFAKDVCAIANSKGGRGYIIYGIKDKTKEVVGVELTPFDEEKLQQLISGRIDPPVPIRVEIVEYKCKIIVVITIFNSDQKPHQLVHGGTFYVRRGSTTDVAKRHEVANMLQEFGIVYFETTMMKHLTIDALSNEKIKKYLSNYTGSTEEEKYLLQGLGIIKQDISSGIFHPTVGGLMLFGKSPQTFLPHTGIKITCMGQTHYVRGTILDMMDEAHKIIENILNNSNDHIKIIDQAIANALVHRDYWDIQRGIVVNIVDDKVEIMNPGVMLNHGMATKNNIIRRNPWLYERLIMIDDKRRLLEHNLLYTPNVKFVNIYKYNLFKLILSGTQFFPKLLRNC